MKLRDDHHENMVQLDHQKLLGFRNLRGLQAPDADLTISSDLAFNKIGAEGPPASPPSRG